VTVTGGGGIACAVGPNFMGSIPAPAQTAGFTTCAANYDFSYTGSFSANGNSGYTWSNPATWLVCPGQSPSNPLFFGHGLTGTGNEPCSDFVITTDSGGGGNQALKLIFTTADYNNNYATTELDSENPYSPYNGNTFPLGMYVDVTARFDTTSYTNTPGHASSFAYGLWDFYWNSPTNGRACTDYVESDLNEIGNFGSSGSAQVFSEWNPSGCSYTRHYPGGSPTGKISNAPGFSPTAYFTYGERYTQNTSGQFAMCSYANDVQISSGPCGTGTYTHGSSDTSIAARYNLIFWNPASAYAAGSTLCNGSCDPGSTPVVSWYKSVVIWTCSSWQNTGAGSGCTGTVTTGTP
jgi:hypothetical protein